MREIFRPRRMWRTPGELRDSYDVVIVGAGGAGLSAAISAAEVGARTLVFECEREVGGSMSQSAGMFTAAGTSVQQSIGVQDDPDKFFQHYMDLNQWRLRPGLIRAFCTAATPTFEWLLGLGLRVPARRSANARMSGLARAGVEDIWRGHVPEGEGSGLVAVLDAARKERGAEVVFGPITSSRKLNGVSPFNTRRPISVTTSRSRSSRSCSIIFAESSCRRTPRQCTGVWSLPTPNVFN